MFAILGEIEFEVASGITGMGLLSTAEWAEHPRIKNKPLLEWVGEGLDQYTITIELHPSLGDPGARQRRLRDAKAKHQPLAFVLGSGDYLGAFVIAEISSVPRRALATGPASIATLSITLQEYTGPVTQPTPKLGLTNLAGQSLSPESLSTVAAIKSNAEAALGYARKATQLVRAGYDVYSAVSQGNPAAVLAQAPLIFSAASQAVAPLNDFTRVAQEIRGVEDLLASGNQALTQVRSALTSLQNLDLVNVAHRVDSSGRSLSQANTIFDSAAPGLVRLAARVATRRV